MFRPRLLLFFLAAIAAPAGAEIGPSDVPGDADWYLHADLEAMRTVSSGSRLYEWLNGEVFVDINEDIGIDLNEEVNSLTAFSDATLGTVIVVEGPISQVTRDKVLALATLHATLDTQSYDGKTWYHVEGDRDGDSGDRRLNGLDESAYFTFAVEDKMIVTSNQDQLEALIDSGGRLTGAGNHNGSLFVLTADKEFVQAGARTAEFADDGDDWNSNILRNTEKVALLVSDRGGLVSVEAQLVSKDPTIASSLGGIINGLISLQAFNADLGPEIQQMIRNTKIEVEGSVLSINAVFDADVVARLLDEEQ